MTPEALQKHLHKVTEFQWRGETVYLRKIGAKDGLDLYARIIALKDKQLSTDEDYKETLNYQVFVVSKSLADDGGAMLFDSDEGREALAQVNLEELAELGDMALRHSGIARGASDEKKSCHTPNVLRTDSAALSDTSMPSTLEPSCLS